MDARERALEKIKDGDLKMEPFRIEIKIKKSAPIDPNRFKLKKDGKMIDMTPPKMERV